MPAPLASALSVIKQRDNIPSLLKPLPNIWTCCTLKIFQIFKTSLVCASMVTLLAICFHSGPPFITLCLCCTPKSMRFQAFNSPGLFSQKRLDALPICFELVMKPVLFFTAASASSPWPLMPCLHMSPWTRRTLGSWSNSSITSSFHDPTKSGCSCRKKNLSGNLQLVNVRTNL